jgi:catechol 2,3-dioxygenase-like lactoylglutathione lyase family enzyme
VVGSVETHGDGTTGTPPVTAGEMKLEVVVVPVSDVDRARGFYEGLGWRLDADLAVEDGYRVVQLTPPGSACSIIFGEGVTNASPGSSEGLQLSVYDIDAARADLVARGIDVSEVFHDTTGIFHHAGTAGRVDGPAPEHADYGPSSPSAIRTATAGCCRRSRPGFPAGKERGMATEYESVDDLAAALRRAAEAHGKHEERIGEEDQNWPDWYALYMVRERGGEELPK